MRQRTGEGIKFLFLELSVLALTSMVSANFFMIVGDDRDER